MSKMGCACGHVIRDQTDDLPYKATVLPDQRLYSFFEWVTEETQSYVGAALANAETGCSPRATRPTTWH